jgi:hypothetical protein
MSEISISSWLIIANIILWLVSVVLAGKGKILDNASTFIACVALILSGFLVLCWLLGIDLNSL